MRGEHRRPLAAVFVVAATVTGAGAVDGAVPWRKYPRLSSAPTRLQVVGPDGKPVPAGTAKAWLTGHAQMNDCMVSDGGGQNVLITCVRRGKYYDTPGKPIKLVFTYTGTFSTPDTLRIVSGTTKGNPLIGQDLIDHFRDEVEE